MLALASDGWRDFTICDKSVNNSVNSCVALQATLLFPGVACFFLAFCAGAVTHIVNEKHVTEQKKRIDGHVSGFLKHCKHPHIALLCSITEAFVAATV